MLACALPLSLRRLLPRALFVSRVSGKFFLGPLSQQLELQRELAHTQQFMSYIDQCRGRETAAAAAAGAAADDAPERET